MIYYEVDQKGKVLARVETPVAIDTAQTFGEVSLIESTDTLSPNDAYYDFESQTFKLKGECGPGEVFNYDLKQWVMDTDALAVYQKDQLRAARDEAIKAGLDYNGHNFQIDPDSQRLIASKALRLQLEPDNTNPVYWRSRANEMVEFTPAEFIEFAKAVSDRVEEIMMASFSSLSSRV